MKHAHARHGTRSGLAGFVVASALVLGVVAALGMARTAPAVGAQSGSRSGATTAQATGPDGAQLYLHNCATCHGQNGEGDAVGPPLVGVGTASTDFYLRTGRMPLGAPGTASRRGQPVFDDPEIEAIVQHVASFGGDGPPIPVVRGGGDVQRGWELYTANCAACHAATGAGNAIGGGFYAVGLGQATDTVIAEAMLVGPGVMPVFNFSDQDRDAIVAYVNFLRRAPSPGGAPIGGFGPVSEGFVAVAIGLTLLVLVAMFVGRRSHAGEPGTPGEAVRHARTGAAASAGEAPRS